MAQKGIREYDGKMLLKKYWNNFFPKNLSLDYKGFLVTKESDFSEIEKNNKWATNSPLVVKPDMLFGKRGKNGLVYFKNDKPGDVKLSDAKKWIVEKSETDTVLLSGQKGNLTHFLVEPFSPHENEYYLSFNLGDKFDEVFFSLQGGINIEENWDSVLKIEINDNLSDCEIEKLISNELKKFTNTEKFNSFVNGAYKFFRDFHFTYLEFNPFVLENNKVILLDLVAKLDDTAAFMMNKYWGSIDFPAPFGRTLSKEENYIKGLDENSGSSLKLTILNATGKIWTLVAGGGASVVYADTIADMGHGDELANYGEYSGNPSTEETCEYAKTIFDLMTRDGKKGKILIIGGAIANFTDVAKTFTGIINAMNEYQQKLKDCEVKVFVRRGGPNYKTGLKNLDEAGNKIGIPIKVFGPETHMTEIVNIAFN